MIRFKTYLNEYRKAPMPDAFSQFTLQKILNDKDNLIQLKVSSVVDQKVIVTFEHTIDQNNVVFILTDRKDNNEIIGYFFAKKVKGKYWQSQGTNIFAPFQNCGLGTDLYINIINAGYQLINDKELSNASEKVWLKLKDKLDIKVLNLETDEIEDWSDKPSYDSGQKWFWISPLRNVNEQVYDDLFKDIDFKRWLRNDLSYDVPGFPGTRYLEEGEY